MAQATTTTTLDDIDADTVDADYTAQLELTASPDTVFDALTTTAGLTAWWTPASGSGLAGGELTFHFGPGSAAVMRVDKAEPGVGVRWTNVACMVEDWVGTTISFDLEPLPSGGTRVHFRHGGLTPKLECFDDCKSGWDHFIPSFAAYAETGTGHPNQSPEDLARREAHARSRETAGE